MFSKFHKRDPIDLPYIYALLGTEFYSDDEKETDKYKKPQLFDPDSIVAYLTSIDDCQRKLRDDEAFDFAEAEATYINLTSALPMYPEAYLELAKLYAKNKDPENSIAYYETYLSLVPFDAKSALAMAWQKEALNKLYPENPPYPNVNVVKAHQRAVLFKEKEDHFRYWYHIRLRKLFALMTLPVTAPIMSLDLDDDTDYKDPTLSNHAVVYAYLAHCATQNENILVANFYHRKAIMLFKDDVLSQTQFIAAYEGDPKKELEELNICIEKYHYPQSYFKRFISYQELNESEKARDSLINFLNYGDKTDFDVVHVNRANMLACLNRQPFVTFPLKSQFTQQAIDAIWIKITRSMTATETKRYKGDYSDEISQLTRLIQDEPYNGQYYETRAYFNLHAKAYANAKIDYSLAIMFSEERKTPPLYMGRLSVNLTIGDLTRVPSDFNNAIYVHNDPNDREPVDTIIKLFSNECLEKAKFHLENGNFAIAEAICDAGIAKMASVDLSLHWAIAHGLQQKYDTALRILNSLLEVKTIDRSTRSTAQWYCKLFLAKVNAALNPGTATTAQVGVVKKNKKRHKARPALVMNPQPPRKTTSNSTSTIHDLLVLERTIDPAVEELLQNEEKPQMSREVIDRDKEIREREKKIRKNERQKLKKAEQRKQRNLALTNNTMEESSHSDTDSIDFQPVCALMPSAEPTEQKPMSLVLQDAEKKVFGLLEVSNAMQGGKEYKSYIVGGWAYDRVRDYFFNIPPPAKQSDIDMVTEIPLEILQTLLPDFKVIPQVQGLLKGRIGDIQVDIICRENLSSLAVDARGRDFTCVYIDANGRIYDPTGFALIYMRDGILKSILPETEVFKRDPLTILRAIYICAMRNLKMAGLKKHIHLDKHLLVPRIGATDIDTLYHPHRFNVLMRKLFSQKRAAKNYQTLDQLGVLEVLFPHIYPAMRNDCGWMQTQMRLSDEITWPKLEIIYANMIVGAVMAKVNEKLADCVNARLQETVYVFNKALVLNANGVAAVTADTEQRLIQYYSDKFIAGSLLFSQLPKLPDVIDTCVRKWKTHKAIKIPAIAPIIELNQEPLPPGLRR